MRNLAMLAKVASPLVQTIQMSILSKLNLGVHAIPRNRPNVSSFSSISSARVTKARSMKMSASDGGRKRYSAKQKLEILAAARATTRKTASIRYRVHCSTIAKWAPLEDQLSQSIGSSKRCERSAATISQSARASGGISQGTAELGSRSQLFTESHLFAARGSASNAPGTISSSTSQPNLATIDNVQPAPHQPEPVATDCVSTVIPTSPFLLIGYQGINGGFGDIVARRAFERIGGGEVESVIRFAVAGYPQFITMLDALGKRELDYAIIDKDKLLSSKNPIVLEKLVSLRLEMVAEISTDEPVSLCALPSTRTSEVDCIMSDWSLLQRYEEFVLQFEKAHNVDIFRYTVWDSAIACQVVREEDAAGP